MQHTVTPRRNRAGRRHVDQYERTWARAARREWLLRAVVVFLGGLMSCGGRVEICGGSGWVLVGAVLGGGWLLAFRPPRGAYMDASRAVAAAGVLLWALAHVMALPL